MASESVHTAAGFTQTEWPLFQWLLQVLPRHAADLIRLRERQAIEGWLEAVKPDGRINLAGDLTTSGMAVEATFPELAADLYRIAA